MRNIWMLTAANLRKNKGQTVSLLLFVLIAAMLMNIGLTIFFGIGAPGYPSTFMMMLLIGGIMLLSCGILGEYLARMYMETKRRPIYIERESSFQHNKQPDKQA